MVEKILGDFCNLLFDLIILHEFTDLFNFDEIFTLQLHSKEFCKDTVYPYRPQKVEEIRGSQCMNYNSQV